MHIQEGIYHKELAHIMMDAEKSHDLLSTYWRPGKASAVVQFESKGLRIKSVMEVKMGVPIQAGRQEFFLLPFVLCGPQQIG